MWTGLWRGSATPELPMRMRFVRWARAANRVRRARHVSAVVGEVVLGQPDGLEPQRFAELHLLEDLPVELARVAVDRRVETREVEQTKFHNDPPAPAPPLR